MERNRNDEAPWVPGLEARFQWPDRDDPDLALVRSGVQEGAKGLYVLYLPITIGGSPVKVLAEAYYPDEMRDATWTMLDPRQRADWQDGRLVVIATVPLSGTFVFGDGKQGSVYAFMQLDERAVEELRRNNRDSRQDLKRQVSGHALKLAIKDELDRKENEVFSGSDFTQAYTDAYLATKEFALGKPRISLHGTGGANRGTE